MGAPHSYKLSSSYNESYNAMGDAVVVPVIKHLIDHLLVPLVLRNGKAFPIGKKTGLQRLLK